MQGVGTKTMLRFSVVFPLSKWPSDLNSSMVPGPTLASDPICTLTTRDWGSLTPVWRSLPCQPSQKALLWPTKGGLFLGSLVLRYLGSQWGTKSRL